MHPPRNMVSGPLRTSSAMSAQHKHTAIGGGRGSPRKPKLLFFISCAAIMLLLTNSASAHAAARSGEVKTAQQLRSRGASAEQYRPKVLAESVVMMTKTSPVAPVAVTEVYGNERLQVVAPTNATVVVESAREQPETVTGNRWAWRIKKVIQSQGFQRMVMGNFMDMNTKKWKPTGNELWDGLITDCIQNPTFSCMQKNMYSYLDRTLLSHDLNVTDNFLFIKNRVNYTDELIRSNEIDDNEDSDSTRLDIDPESQKRSLNDDDDTTGEEAESPLEEVTNAMYDKTRKFAMTHDIQLKLPQMMFDGAILRISPRSFEGNGALVKIELEPDTRALQERHGTPRIMILKKIKKIFKNKLLLGFLAVVFVIKLIKIKILWLLPFLIGYGAAKKLVLKVLLFFFPALAHIFKLCSWYHHNYHHGSTKLHHHKHHISHTHTVIPPWFESHGPPHDGVPLIYTKPPTGHPSEYIHGAPPAFEHYPQDWELSGPGLGAEYISNRKSQDEPNSEEPKDTPQFGHHPPQTVAPSASSHSLHINPFTQSPPPDSKYNVRHGPSFKNPTASRIAAQYQAMPDPRHNSNTNLAAIDPFYGPILTKIDTIFAQLGVNDEPCKERLLCSMYKNPTQYSPHSNFISAELSRDASELKKAPNPNVAVTRFYRYIQAARDGQDHRDCLALYNLCAINTEQRRK